MAVAIWDALLAASIRAVVYWWIESWTDPAESPVLRGCLRAVAGLAEGLQVLIRMIAACCKRTDMVNFGGLSGAALLLAVLAERLSGQHL